jgi:prepilin-type N-terminal cleavage/methylation domain-containing protein
MSDRSTKRGSGFSLLEMVIAMALGTLVLGAAVQLYSQGVAATWTVSQRAEMQQDFRAASAMLTKDLSLAGSGLGNNVQIGLPTTSTTPVYGCDQSLKCYINGAAASYPKQGSVPYLYGLIPGWKYGPTLNAPQGPTDVVTVVYTDGGFFLNCYNVTVTSSTLVTFTLPSPLPTGCVLPSGVTAPQNVNDAVAGLTAGDLIWFTLTPAAGCNPCTPSPVVAEVTGAVTATSSTTYTVPFATGDVLKMNQTTAASGSLANVVGDVGTSKRILVITYYIDNTLNPPRLMRQISGHSPMPVAENVVYLKFSYDLYNSNTEMAAPDQADGGAGLSPALTPNQITKINIKHMTMDSTLKGAKGGYQGLDLQTSVSARDLTYSNGYPLQ